MCGTQFINPINRIQEILSNILTKPTLNQLNRLINWGQLYFLGEAVARSDTRSGSIWGKKGVTLIIKNGGGRFGVKVISAILPKGYIRFQF